MKQKYESLVHQTIPISQAIGWGINQLDSSSISALVDLTPNINIHGTGFAGSLYAGAMATGWTLMKCWADSHGFVCEHVAAEANIKYLAPVTTNFECQSYIDQTTPQYDKLNKRLLANRNCAFPLPVEIKCRSKVCAILVIQFVFKSKVSNQ